MKNAINVQRFMLVFSCILCSASLAAQNTTQSGTTSVSLDFATLEAAANLQFSEVNNTATPATGFPAGFAITGETPFEYALNPFAPVGGSISHTGSVTFTVVGAGSTVEVGDFEIGFDPVRAVGGNSGFFVEDTISGLGILFDVGTPNPITASVAGVLIAAPLNVSPEFASYLSTNGLAASDLTGAEVGAAQVNASSTAVTITSGSTSVNLDFETLASAASLVFASVSNTATPADGFPAGFRITTGSPFQYTLNPFSPVGGSISHTGGVVFTISGTEDTVEVGNFNIGFDPARAVGGNSGFFVQDTISDLGILFDVAAPDSLSATPNAFMAEADLNVSSEFAGFLSGAELAASDLTGATVGSALIDGLAAAPGLTPKADNEFLGISTRGFIAASGSEAILNSSVIISGSEPMNVLFRARSTSINLSGVDLLPNPVIDVVRIGEGIIGTNDSYLDAEHLSMLSGTQYDPTLVGMNEEEALLLLLDLAPGAYSVRVRSAVDGETGLAIVEALVVE